ncbi:MAG: hypothetical protein ACM3S5_05640 [Rhodospirillales bacterium]
MLVVGEFPSEPAGVPALGTRSNVTFRSYPKLKAGEGQSTPAEYQKPGQVAAEAVDCIATWILKTK